MTFINVAAEPGNECQKSQGWLGKLDVGRSLMAKFILFSAPVILLCNAFFLYLYADFRREAMQDELAVEMAALAVRTSQSLKAPLRSGDAELGRSLLGGLAGHPDVICGEVFDAGGQKLFAWPGLGCGQIQERGTAFERPIKDRRQNIGSLTIEYRQSLLEEKLFADLLYIVAALAFSGMIAVVFTSIVHWFTIGRPLGRLLSALNKTAQAGARGSVKWRSRDQLGIVIKAYNRMSETEARRKAQLRAANDELKVEIAERLQAEKSLKETQAQLIQASKMEALGTLAGGIAHEINTPIQYIGDNLRFLSEGFGDLRDLIGSYETVIAKVEQTDSVAAVLAELEKQKEISDADYLFEEAAVAAQQSLDGVGQVSQIVTAMKEFSHPRAKETGPVALNAIIERATAICRGEWRQAATLELDLEESLSDIQGLESELNQVILNLVVNASHAIADTGRTDGRIDVISRATDNGIRLEVRDNGNGIPDEVQARIFDPFFTTKEVGKGSGQGLAICHDIIFNKHGGKIYSETESGAGTRFIVELPGGAGTGDGNHATTRAA
ncbi:ATP-binding protein [Denitrobaculum tricleocarpae]|uniref:histidine kinase n=1 Tax=Denitrobaculum tricleocarpae TaxID=2591009 RepID=A0A545TKV7_9PROT|nr:ATP-binding protein [Denitrobaculum tricleocarpae]TQV77854.1 hypothetical protein FKG95_20085 [Denitrobaculum tricleocarpae]